MRAFPVFLEYLNQTLTVSAQISCRTMVQLLSSGLHVFCGASERFEKNAILWTHFVTPRGDQTQHDQTNPVSYYKKERSEELGNLIHTSSGSGLVGTVYFCGGCWLLSCGLQLVEGL
jgi:hypothetical protein